MVLTTILHSEYAMSPNTRLSVSERSILFCKLIDFLADVLEHAAAASRDA